MDMARIFGMPAALLVLAYVANRLAKLTRIPDLIVLLVIGVSMGPVFHLVNPDLFRGAISILGTLALILILFEGGLELRLRHALGSFPAGLLLVATSFGLSLVLVALIGRALLHLAWNDCLLLGAALGCTSGAVVIPSLQQIETPEPVKTTLTIEASLGEILAVLVVGSLLNTSGSASALIAGMAVDFGHHIGVAIGFGLVAGAIWSRLWPLIAGQAYSNILNLGVVLGLYASARYFEGSGLLTVLIFGVTLSNLPRTPHMARQGARLLAFHAELSFLVRSFFFVMLGVVAEVVSRDHIVPILGILAGLLLARLLSVQLSRWAVRGVDRKDTSLLFWMMPRGLVTAVLALEIVAARGPIFSFLPAMAFTVILITNVLIIWGSIRAGSSPALDLAAPEHAAGAQQIRVAAPQPAMAIAEAAAGDQ